VRLCLQIRIDARNGPLRGADYSFAPRGVNGSPPLADATGLLYSHDCHDRRVLASTNREEVEHQIISVGGNAEPPTKKLNGCD
jgi:hypothetical protein